MLRIPTTLLCLLALAACSTPPTPSASAPQVVADHQTMVDGLVTELRSLPGPARFLRLYSGREFGMVLVDLDEEDYAFTVISNQSDASHTVCIDLPPYSMVDGCVRRGDNGSMPALEAQQHFMRVIGAISQPRT